MLNHQCKTEDLVRNPRPVEYPEDNGETIAFILKCRICGRELQEIFTKQDGLWDPDKEKYVQIGGE